MKSLSSRAIVYGLLILLGAVFATPSFLPESMTEKLPSWYAKQHISLGLDLRGGSQLLLAIDEKALLTQDSQRLADDFSKVLRKERLAHGRIRVTEKSVAIPLLNETVQHRGARQRS